MESLWQDVRFGVRMLGKSRMFTLVAVLSLALGIGANTATFSLINALLLRLLPVKAARELALVTVVGPNLPSGALYAMNYPLYEMFRDRNQSFAGMLAGTGVGRARLTISGAVEPIEQQRVSGNFFAVLGVQPVLGRVLTEADDDAASAQPAAVISYEYWQRRFGGDAQIIGRPITVNETALVVAGVAPPGFFGIDVASRPELWWPLEASRHRNLSQPRIWWLQVIGRLRPGVSRTQAQAELEVFMRQQLDEIAATQGAQWTPRERRNFFNRRLRLEEGGGGYTGLRREFRRPLLVLMATVSLVLLIACVNLASLLLARAAARRKEIAMRLALGAGPLRLARQLLTESMLLALLGGAAGCLVAPLCLRLLITYLPVESRGALDVSPDARVLGFTLAVSVLTGLLFGLAPAFQAARLNLTAAMKEQSGPAQGRSHAALGRLLVVTQVALALCLLIGAGLFVRSLRNLRTLDAGMDYGHIVQFEIDTGSGYDDARRGALYRQTLARLEALPGVQAATLLSFGLLAGRTGFVDVVAPGQASGEKLRCNVLQVGPRFFEMMKQPLLSGRDFAWQDERPVQPRATSTAALPEYAVINQTMARQLFGEENPIGKRLQAVSIASGGKLVEIIGVTQDARVAGLREPPSPTFYLYYFQQPGRDEMAFQLRTMGEPSAYAASIQRAVRELDPQLQIVDLRTLSEVVNTSLVQERFIAQTAGAFSLFALLLAALGLYGVMSHAVARRTSEIGIRMALGAQRRDVLWLVLREAMLLVVAGVGIGVMAALGAMRFVSGLLFGLTHTDPLTIATAALLMIGVALLAGYLPARRAAQVDPLIALRQE
ncbi:MAG: ABC transporter permease [Blastocatellia bacterium]